MTNQGCCQNDNTTTGKGGLRMLLSLCGICILITLGIVGYFIASQSDGDREFRALCENGMGKSAWMKMKPMRDGVTTDLEACWGCMADANNMFCDQLEYERFKTENSSASTMPMEEM